MPVQFAQANFAPFMPTVIILGPVGQNVDVASHEWAHAEISTRLGFLRRNLKLPVWFDEGLAMRLDHLSSFSSKGLQRLLENRKVKRYDLKDLTARSQFYVTGEQGSFHYAFSKCVVSDWLSKIDERDISARLNDIIPLFGSNKLTGLTKNSATCMKRN